MSDANTLVHFKTALTLLWIQHTAMGGAPVDALWYSMYYLLGLPLSSSTVAEVFPNSRLGPLRRRKKFWGLASFSHHTACRAACLSLTTNAGARGEGRFTLQLHTAWGTSTFSLTSHKKKKKRSYRRNGMTENFSGFETLTFSYRGIPWNR